MSIIKIEQEMSCDLFYRFAIIWCLMIFIMEYEGELKRNVCNTIKGLREVLCKWQSFEDEE